MASSDEGAVPAAQPSKYCRERLQEVSAPYVISPNLFEAYRSAAAEQPGRPAEEIRLWVIVELNLDDQGGRRGAHDRIAHLVSAIIEAGDGAEMKPADSSRHHIFARLSLGELRELVRVDSQDAKGDERAPAIFKVWPDRQLEAYLDRSVRIIKADACLRSFGADGDGIVWAVADSGIDGHHPHFAHHKNLELPPVGRPPARSGRPGRHAPLNHRDFTTSREKPLTDGFGHGTHVAGIIAGSMPGDSTGATKVFRIVRERNEHDQVRHHVKRCEKPFGAVAPKAKVVSLKVLDDDGTGQESALLSAIDYVSRVNDDGRWPRIHGMNISLGYPFDAEWFAAGQSPLCVAVNRLVKQGVAVVVAAGNDGSALIVMESSPAGRRIGMDQSITDPGNADGAITVGSTHPEQPHTYGISYFSSRGPTADGRQKPDLVAPGEHILSAASPGSIERLKVKDPGLRTNPELNDGTAAFYRQESGTSMAAPHVSGAIAAFLSVRPEFIGQPERVKEILMTSATDLRRRCDFQGAGLLDLLRAIQSV